MTRIATRWLPSLLAALGIGTVSVSQASAQARAIIREPEPAEAVVVDPPEAPVEASPEPATPPSRRPVRVERNVMQPTESSAAHVVVDAKVDDEDTLDLFVAVGPQYTPVIEAGDLGSYDGGVGFFGQVGVEQAINESGAARGFVEVNYQTGESTFVDMSLLSITGNGAFAPRKGRVGPYIGGGLGVQSANFESNFSADEDSGTAVAVRGLLGLEGTGSNGIGFNVGIVGELGLHTIDRGFTEDSNPIGSLAIQASLVFKF